MVLDLSPSRQSALARDDNVGFYALRNHVTRATHRIFRTRLAVRNGLIRGETEHPQDIGVSTQFDCRCLAVELGHVPGLRLAAGVGRDERSGIGGCCARLFLAVGTHPTLPWESHRGNHRGNEPERKARHSPAREEGSGDAAGMEAAWTPTHNATEIVKVYPEAFRVGNNFNCRKEDDRISERQSASSR